MCIIEFLVDMFVKGFLVIAACCFISMALPEKKKAPEVSEAEPYVQSVYPIEFRAAFKDKVNPTLYVSISGKSHFLMKPLVKDHFEYTYGRLIYFGDEEKPVGFEMYVTGEDGLKRKAVFHRGRPKYHTQWSYKVRYGKTADSETVSEIIKAANKNILCLDMTKHYGEKL